MDYSKFTPSYKDGVLKKLCDDCPPYCLVSFVPSLLDDDIELLKVALNQFQENGFIKDLNLRKDRCGLILQASAFDFLNSGGFTAEHYLKEASLDKLVLQLEELSKEPSFKARIPLIDNAIGIISNVVTLFGN